MLRELPKMDAEPKIAPAPDIVRLSRARMRHRDRLRIAIAAGLAACFAFGSVTTYNMGLQAIDEILTNRRKPALTPVAAAPPGARDVRQIPLSADATPVATIPQAKPEPSAPRVGAQAFPPVERAPTYSGFKVTAGN